MMAMTPAIHLSARIPATDQDFEAIVAMIEEWEAKGHSRSAVIVDGLRALLGYVPRYADNPAGKLAQIQNTGGGSVELLLAQFDILNSRIDLIIDKLHMLQEQGFSAQAVQSVIEDDDLPPDVMAELRARFNSVNG